MKDKDMLNRMLTNGSNDGFIMLKDHKVNFKNNPKVSVVNPEKNKKGQISKKIVNKINHKLQDSIGVHQRKYTSKGIEWLF